MVLSSEVSVAGQSQIDQGTCCVMACDLIVMAPQPAAEVLAPQFIVSKHRFV